MLKDLEISGQYDKEMGSFIRETETICRSQMEMIGIKNTRDLKNFIADLLIRFHTTEKRISKLQGRSKNYLKENSN